MKRIFTTALSLTLAVIMALLGAAQVLADSEKTYVSEVKVAMGGSAESDLTNEGFTILCDDNGDPVDLNQGAGGGKGSLGNKKVLLGYKTTTKRTEAITDLAVMNMCGGYDVNEYELLMKRYMGAQIKPFIDKFIVAINEYRENIESEDEVNRQRAEYIRGALNMFTDDDCGGAGLGDLLLNETIYEMAKPQFDSLSEKEQEDRGIAEVNAEVRDALPEEEKNEHCDILTLFAQADGQIMLMIYDLITRAADTGDDSWIDRFTAMTYDDLLDTYDLAPTDAKKKAARDFDDDANTILENWETFRTQLVGADTAAEVFNNIELPDYDGLEERTDALDDDSTFDDAVEVYAEAIIAESTQSALLGLAASFSVADYLAGIEYGEGTLYDFFTRSVSEVQADITSLYPLVAALSEGQRAGMEFISLRELVMIGNRDIEYSDEALEDLTVTSVYEGVDRGIYQKGGVALTSDALRTRALAKDQNRAAESWFSTKLIVMWAITGASLIGFLSTVSSGVRYFSTMIKESKLAKLKDINKANKLAASAVNGQKHTNKFIGQSLTELNPLEGYEKIKDTQPVNLYVTPDTVYGEIPRIDVGRDLNTSIDSVDSVDEIIINTGYNTNTIDQQEVLSKELSENATKMNASTRAAAWMSVGFAAATFIMTGVSAYMTWKELKDYYKVDFAVIPHYMVDETSITYYNDNGEKLVRENHAAYYEAVKCFRKEGDKNYDALTDCADLNGEVGQQWLALYACKNYKQMQPILADSFKVVVGSGEIPAGYDNRGIHMFGSDSAFNLNSKLYDWNQSAKSVFVYFKVDETAPLGDASTSGSAFSAGRVAVAAIGGVTLGALVTALAMTAVNKRKSKKATAAAQ